MALPPRPGPPRPSAHRGTRGSCGGLGGSGHSGGRQTRVGTGSGQRHRSPRAGSPWGCSRTLRGQEAHGALSQAGRDPSPPPTLHWGRCTHAGRGGSGSSQGHSGRTPPPRILPGTCTGPSRGHRFRPPRRGWSTGRLQGGGGHRGAGLLGSTRGRRRGRSWTHAGSPGRRSPGRRAHSACPGSWVCTHSAPPVGPSGRRCPGSQRRCSHSLWGGGGEESQGPRGPQSPPPKKNPSLLHKTPFLTLETALMQNEKD